MGEFDCRFDAVEPSLEQDGTAEQELQLAEARYELASCSSYLTKAHGDLLAVLCTDESAFAAVHGQGGMLEDKQVRNSFSFQLTPEYTHGVYARLIRLPCACVKTQGSAHWV